MASDTILLYAGIASGILVLAAVIFSFFNKRTPSADRIHRILAAKAAGRREADSPVLVHGTAGSSRAFLPVSGEPVAFYAAFIMSGDTTLLRPPGERPLPSDASFRVFTTSGDFSVDEGTTTTRVSIVSALGQIAEAGPLFTHDQMMNAVLDGVPENVFAEMVAFEGALRTLAPVLAITVTGRSIRSAIDSRTSRFVQGTDLPPAIAEMLKAKIIRPRSGTEILVTEFFIPQNQNIWVFGTYETPGTVRYGNASGGLLVSYTDPTISLS